MKKPCCFTIPRNLFNNELYSCRMDGNGVWALPCRKADTLPQDISASPDVRFLCGPIDILGIVDSPHAFRRAVRVQFVDYENHQRTVDLPLFDLADGEPYLCALLFSWRLPGLQPPCPLLLKVLSNYCGQTQLPLL